MATGVAVDAQEAVGQHAALEVVANFSLDEAGDGRARRASSGEEGHNLRADDLMKEGLLGLVTGVVGDGACSAGTGRAG